MRRSLTRRTLTQWGYCKHVLRLGGPARAVHLLERESTFFQQNFEIDRSQERYVFTQHPGGWLRRRENNQSGA